MENWSHALKNKTPLNLIQHASLLNTIQLMSSSKAAFDSKFEVILQNCGSKTSKETGLESDNEHKSTFDTLSTSKISDCVRQT